MLRYHGESWWSIRAILDVAHGVQDYWRVEAHRHELVDLIAAPLGRLDKLLGFGRTGHA